MAGGRGWRVAVPSRVGSRWSLPRCRRRRDDGVAESACQDLEVIDADLEGYREEKEPGGSEDTRREKNRDRKYRFIISMPPIHPLLLSYNTKSRTMLSLEIVITSLKTRLRR
jgi:hypothetical protein